MSRIVGSRFGKGATETIKKIEIGTGSVIDPEIMLALASDNWSHQEVEQTCKA
jgi:hypothetical protein